jgi:hypothetical protein
VYFVVREEAVVVAKRVSEVVCVSHGSGERAGDTAVVTADRCDNYLGQIPGGKDFSMATRLSERCEPHLGAVG